MVHLASFRGVLKKSLATLHKEKWCSLLIPLGGGAANENDADKKGDEAVAKGESSTQWIQFSS